MKKIKAVILSLFALSLLFSVPALAQNNGPYIGLDYGQATGLGKNDIRLTIARIINVLLGLLGTVAIVIILWAGFKWMTAGGNNEDIDQAKKILISSVIGLAIILSAYAISNFVLTQLYKSTTGFDYRE
ncbi:MAG: hypothetical protein COV59_04560 [Candidatus Magasanikbacteria bacterium CG11_big_fil_rev_8_21_14_0_20_39_34]|uniref:Uncharacterized protein n=1 Tax=Candidatus Magasanikbacteria bacterium CG11_big_fil_rev_8_21_14_0_20_39_34 TaxID=1974653 RepID=A0A2H0N6H5_9BACT|nr:MAG: hypothetical protein COV59_04560 [Candidatus Magasanikbacteria bacterium CG11_big_fil_rev_8_21_14_0_20_39_34]